MDYCDRDVSIRWRQLKASHRERLNLTNVNGEALARQQRNCTLITRFNRSTLSAVAPNLSLKFLNAHSPMPYERDIRADLIHDHFSLFLAISTGTQTDKNS